MAEMLLPSELAAFQRLVYVVTVTEAASRERLRSASSSHPQRGNRTTAPVANWLEVGFVQPQRERVGAKGMVGNEAQWQKRHWRDVPAC